MAITYDKKGLKKMEKMINMGNNKFAITRALYLSIFNAVFISLFLFVFDYKDGIETNWKNLIIKFLLLLVLLFVTYYFFQKIQWKEMKKTYEESKEYWDKTDPDFLK
ncbi:MAG: hypothetical protein R2771_01540 [Saprospiraceae bacterium]